MSACCHGLCLKTVKQSKTFTINTNFMRKHCLWIPCIGCILILFSCKKENIDVNPPQSPSNEKLIPKIKSWLDEQKKGLSTISAARIDSLQQNLNYGEIRLEKYKESKEFILIPVLPGLKSKNNSDKNPASYLLLVFENKDSIKSGNIVQYVSSNSQKAIPKNTFYKIFSYQDLDCSGQFTILSITDFFRYELKFEKGKFKSMVALKKKNARNGSSRTVSECIEWYEQIWYVWADGTVELVSETYVFTTCDSDCAQARLTNGRSYGTNCNGNGAGGGGVDYDACVSAAVSAFQSEANGAHAASQTTGFDVTNIDGMTKYKNPKWRILKGWSGWDLESQEIGVIKLINAQTNQWAWKSLTHGLISMVGSPPLGVSVEYNQGLGTPSFTPETAAATTVLYGGMSLNYNVTYRLFCNCPNIPLFGQIPPIIRAYTSNAIWNSNPI